MSQQQMFLGGGLWEPMHDNLMVTAVGNKETTCLRNAWNAKLGQFDPCILPSIASIPALVAACCLLWKILSLFITRRPAWTRPFVEEIAEPRISLDEIAPQRRWGAFTISLTVLSGLGLMLQLAVAIRSWTALERVAPAASWAIVLGLLVVVRPRTAPMSLMTIYIFQAVAAIIMLSNVTGLDNFERSVNAGSTVLSILAICCILCMPLRDTYLSSKDISRPFTEPTSSLLSPEDNLTPWQFMTVSWMAPMITVGRKRQMHDEDVWQLGYEFHHQRLHDNFRLLKGTVIQRLVRANIIDICLLVFLGVFELVLQYSTPLLLQKVLASMEDPTAPKRATIVYAVLSLVVRMTAAQSGVFSLWYGRRCYERSRGEMITMLYEKTLARKIAFASEKDSEKTASNGNAGHSSRQADQSNKNKAPLWKRPWRLANSCFRRQTKNLVPVKEPASMGKILNLMRNDVYEVAQRFWEIQALIQKPLSLIFSIVLVVALLGVPSMLAIFVVCAAQLTNIGLARVLVHYEKKRRFATDDKLQITSQFIEAIRHLRWYGWQDTWLSQIMVARQKELNLRVISSIWNTVITYVNVLSLEMTPVLAFFAYTVIARQPLRVDLAFPAMDVLSMLTSSLRDIPQLFVVMINAWVAVERIEDFMAEADRQEMNTEALAGDEMALDYASFAWPGVSHAVLHEINISFPKGLSVVYGEVAAGKSALLQALLGELDLLHGQLIRPREPIAYCAQTPWLQSMSIRENILFGSVYDDKRYKGTLEVCALTPDLAEFGAGDLSLIGENGIGLSGGQRARVALARAVYSKAKIVMLDDPLSALDQQTAEFIAQKCLRGPLLQGRTIVLVTHRTDLVSSFADQMIHVENGRAFVIDRDAQGSLSLQRTTSTQSRENLDEAQLAERNAAAVPDKFIEDEHRAHGGVSASVYWAYVKAGKYRWWVALISLLAVWRVSIYGQAWFLKSWSEAYQRQSTLKNSVGYAGNIMKASWDFTDRLPRPDVNIRPWLLGFFFFGLALSTLYTIAMGIMIVITYTASKNMFIEAMEMVAGATFRFYDITPVGRLMNRVTSDIGVVDGNLSGRFQQVTSHSLSWISAVVVIATVTPTFLLFGAVLAVAFVTIFLRFLPTSQSLRRLEMVSLTPLMSNFGTLLTGLSTVRAFHAQRQFQDRVVRVVDTFQKMDHFYWSLQNWLMFRFDTMSAVSTFMMTILALATNITPGLTAFVLLAAEKFVLATHRLCKQYGQLQMDFVSVERVVEMLRLEQEPKGDISPPAWWPSFSGDVVFDNVSIRYAPHLDPALSDISFRVKGGSKTAIIGRTGSGKSTLALAMLATVVPEAGQILVDNVDLAKVDKQLLRTKVTFLAQDPVLFPGSMRENLDPVREHSDEECDLVLQRVCERQEWTLKTNIEGGGRNLSQGQRQLVGLARAVLRRSAIIILDEATASIDRETAMQIQQVMHEEMKDSTVITIAHRLEAVRNADYCIILGKGRILQQGPASDMLEGYKSDMIDDDEDHEN